ncbi:MAG: beta-propeller domain-containing protein [Desulfosalsimonadaceae bacterium]
MKTCKIKAFRPLLIAVFLAAVLAIAGCNEGGTSKTSIHVSSFESDEALTSYLKEQYATSATPSQVRNYMMEADATAPVGGDDKGFSGTNIQEAGVDESDVVKTDGDYLYVASDSDVRIIAAKPAESMNVVSYVKAGGSIDSIYLYGGKLVAIYRPSSGVDEPIVYREDEKISVGMPYWIPYQEKTGILIVDVSNPAAPATIKDIQVDGYLVTSRITGGNLHVVAQFLPDLPPLEIWYDGSEVGKEAVTEANNQTLAPLTLDDFVPSYTVCDAGGAVVEEGRAVATQNFIRPGDENGGTMISIITIDMENPAADFTSTGFIADAHNVYASTDALYLVSTIYNYTDVEKPVDNLVDDGNGFAAEWRNPTFETQIYKFDLGDAVTFSAQGRVDGEILNQFSLGEYDGVLRIATTTGNTWEGTSKNHVFCLKNNGDKLEVIGSIRDLAPGERLYSARFMGERGYLVTFVQVDPLFTLDLSDPAHPSVAGELKVPGYSTYLHPLNENYLLSVGQDTTVEGDIVKNGGLQLSIYDIHDFSNPKLLHTAKIGDSGTYSEAMYNHKAVTFWPEQNLLALPVNEYTTVSSDNGDAWENSFNGMVVYRLTEDYDFELLGRMNLYSYDASDTAYYYPSWYRGMFIDDYFYGITSNVVKAAPVDDIKEPFAALDLME